MGKGQGKRRVPPALQLGFICSVSEQAPLSFGVSAGLSKNPPSSRVIGAFHENTFGHVTLWPVISRLTALRFIAVVFNSSRVLIHSGQAAAWASPEPAPNTSSVKPANEWMVVTL